MFELHKLTHLSRGGYILKTSAGLIQFGVPPETIKDTLQSVESVPFIYVLPKKLFSIERGVSFSDVEFPIYYNFYLAHRKVIVICTEQQKKRTINVMKQALFGPDNIDLEHEFVNGKITYGYPDMRSEMRFFRRNPMLDNRETQIDDHLEFIHLDTDCDANYAGVRIHVNDDGDFEVYDQEHLAATINGDFSLSSREVKIKETKQPFYPPIFGITTLGNSHGYDPNERTSGLIIWVNRRGIMIDPPVDSTDWLIEHEVNSKLIDSVILTHCHADHDAGTLQKIVDEHKIDLYTTTTVLESFLIKSEALTDIDRDYLRRFVNFKPVTIGQPIHINGGEFWFHYSFHSIPTIRFEIFFRGKSLIYTSDHLYDPSIYKKLHDEGVISDDRYRFLMDFPWGHDIIIHESGIPPLHTPLEILLELEPEIKSKIFLVHMSRHLLPKDSGLRIAPTGLENTIVIDVKPPAYNDAVEILDVLTHIDLFDNFPLRKAHEFLMLARREHFYPGEMIIAKGSPGRNFYMILSGKVKIVRGDTEMICSNNDYFGETSLIMDEVSNADAIAKTDVTALVLNKQDFLHFIEGSKIEEDIRNLEENRKTLTWRVLEKNQAFRHLTVTQKNQMLLIMKLKQFKKGDILETKGTLPQNCYLIESGKVGVMKEGRERLIMTNGEFVGDIIAMHKGDKLKVNYQVLSDTAQIYCMDAHQMTKYIDRNPGVYLRLMDERLSIAR